MLKGTGKGKVTNCTINCTINCMPKQILVIPDIHGRRFWREPVHRMIDDVDRVVFLGDYLDPYPDEGVVYSPEELRQNLTEIVALKQEQPEKVVLLKGNHDQPIWNNDWLKPSFVENMPYDTVVNEDTLKNVTPVIVFREQRAYLDAFDGMEDFLERSSEIAENQ